MTPTTSFFSMIKSASSIERAVILILLSYPTLLLTVRSSMGVLFGLLLIFSLVELYRKRKSNTPSLWDRTSIIFSLTMASPVVAIFLSEAYHANFNLPSYDWASRFLLAIPIFLALRQQNIRALTVMQLGIPIGTLAGLLMLVLHPFDWGGGRYTTSFFFNLIHFSDTALILGFLSLFSIDRERKELLSTLILKLCGFVAGIYISIQSGERGGWIAIAPLLLIFVAMHSKKNLRSKLAIAMAMIIVSVLIGYYNVDIVYNRINGVFSDLHNYEYGNKDTSSGTRLQLYAAAINLFIENPLFGVGPGGFAQSIPALTASGVITPHAGAMGAAEAHSEILHKCAEMGMFGLLSISSIYLVPLFIFLNAAKSKESTARISSRMGIFLVTGFFIFGLTVEIFNLKMTATFFALTIAVLMAAATHQDIPGRQPQKQDS